MKRNLLIITLLPLLISISSIVEAQTLTKFEKWQSPSFFRGSCMSDWNIIQQALASQEDFSTLKETGANLVIIQSAGTYDELPPYGPNIWYTEPGYTIYWQDIMDSLVSLARSAGMYYVLTVRTGPGRNDVAGNDPTTIWTNPEEQQLYGKMLKEIAARYLPDDLFVGFDLTAEPNPLPDFEGSVSDLWAALQANGIDVNALYKIWIDSVRTVAPDLPLLVEGVHWSDPEYFPLLEKQDDDFIVYSAHCYNPHDYSHAQENYSVTYPGDFWNVTLGNMAFYDKTFFEETVLASVRTLQVSNNVPIIVGELGIMHPQNGGEQYISDIMSIALSYGWHFSLWNWNNDYSFGYRYIDETYGTHYMDSIRYYFNKSITGIEDDEGMISEVKALPNPFSENVSLYYNLKEPAQVCLSIYNITGNKVITLVNENQEQGDHKAVFDSYNLPSGLYYYTFYAGNRTCTGKILLLR